MKSSTAIAIVVIIALVFAGIFLFSGGQEETVFEPPPAGEIIGDDLEDISEVQTSDDVFNTIDDTLQILE